MAIRRLDSEAEQSLYVGDHPVDAEAAAAAGVPFIACLSDTHDRSAFDEFQPRAIIDDVSALPQTVLRAGSLTR